MELNLVSLGVAALSTLAVGFVYFHPKVMGNAWMKSAGLKEEDLKGGNMLVIFGLSVIMAFFIAFFFSITVPATHIVHDPTMTEGYRSSFGHGAYHGFFLAIIMAMPVIVTISLFERKSPKYIFIHIGYWIIAISLMGGIIDAWPQ